MNSFVTPSWGILLVSSLISSFVNSSCGISLVKSFAGSFVITNNISQTSFSVNMGTGTTNPTASGTMFALPEGFASNDGVITENNENLNGRMSPTYAGITTTLSADILNATTDEVNITNIGNYNISNFTITRSRFLYNFVSHYAVIKDSIIF